MNVNNCENKCYWLWKWRLKEWQRRTVRLKLMALKGNWTVMRVKTKDWKSENEELDEWKWRNGRVVVTLERYWVWVPRKSARAWVKLEPFFCRKVRFFHFCSFFEKFRFRRRSDHDRRRIFFGRKNESPGTGSDFSSRIHSAPKSIGWAEYERSMKAVVFYRRRWRRSYRVVGLFPKLALEKIECISFIFKGQRL